MIYIVKGAFPYFEQLRAAFERHSCPTVCFGSIDEFLLQIAVLQAGTVLLHLIDLCSNEWIAIGRVLERPDLELVLATQQADVARALTALNSRRAIVLPEDLEPDGIAAAVAQIRHDAANKRRLGVELLQKLTPCEREVLRLLLEGWPTKRIASSLNRSLRTVETHRQRIKRRVHVSSWAQLIRLVYETGFDQELMRKPDDGPCD